MKKRFFFQIRNVLRPFQRFLNTIDNSISYRECNRIKGSTFICFCNICLIITFAMIYLFSKGD